MCRLAGPVPWGSGALPSATQWGWQPLPRPRRSLPTAVGDRLLSPLDCGQRRLHPAWLRQPLLRGSPPLRHRQADKTSGLELDAFPPKKQDPYLQYLEPAKRPSSSDWLRSLCGLPKSRVLHRIRSPLFTATAVALIVSVLHWRLGLTFLPTLSAHTLLGSGLSLLLVFRTNSAYQRFQEGRKIWNDILDISRDIALSVSLYKKEAGPEKIRLIRTLLQAFPFMMQEHVRAKGSKSMKERRRQLLAELNQDLPEPDPADRPPRPAAPDDDRGPAAPRPPKAKLDVDRPKLGRSGAASHRNRPLRIAWRLMKVLKSIPNRGDLFTNRERVWLLSMANQLSHTVGRCERLVQTPVPLSYARHTQRFVSIWTLTLPLALVESHRWFTTPVTVGITWAMFGILEIGHSIEDPFRRTIELTPICEAIYSDTQAALSPERPAPEGDRAGAPAKGQRASGGPPRARLSSESAGCVGTNVQA